ncbi:hypothetical protein P792_11400 [Asaia sp. SF2.1]|nr:hypothetical protein P792_11400 [Asaia sp. SF2.1]
MAMTPAIIRSARAFETVTEQGDSPAAITVL